MSRGTRVGVGGVCLAIALMMSGLMQVSRPQPAGATGHRPGDITSVELTQLGFTDLASLGLDGTTKPRGQNGDVAVLGNTAYVGGGSLFHGAQSTIGRICTDYGGVKVVNISNPAAPTVTNTITVEDYKGVVAGPVGNNRRNQMVNNVAASVSAVDVFRHPVANMDILAIATQRCEPSFFNGARIEFWNVTNPAAPVRIQTFDGPLVITPPATTPAPREWGIYEEVRMFARSDGRVYATTVTPFSVGNAHDAIGNGDFRILDITDIGTGVRPTQIGNFPTANMGSGSNNGCRTFQGGRNAVPTPDKNSVIFSDYDGIQPPDSSIEPTGLPDPGRSAAVMKLDLDNLPVYDNTPAGSPRTFTPKPKSWGYAPGTNGGMTAGGAMEGNAADVTPFTGPTGSLNTVVSEDDLSAALTNFHINGPANLYQDTRACEPQIGKYLYELPDQQLSGDVVYVGRACPASPLEKDTLPVADPLLADPAGKIALFESGGSLFNGCSAGDKVKRLADAGATGVIASLGGPFLNQFIMGPNGPKASVPFVGVTSGPYNAMAGYVPNRILSGPTTTVPFPAVPYQRSSPTNVTIKPYALAVTGATNATPIEITTAVHGLATGDKVTISGVTGNAAANANWTVTVVSATKFSLDGSVGSGSYAGGGVVQPCPLSDPSCAGTPTRTDFARFRSTANATDRLAEGKLNAAVVTTTAPATALPPAPVGTTAAQNITISVVALTTALNSGTQLRFTNGGVATLTAAAAAGATSIQVSGTPDNLPIPIPADTKGSPAFDVVPGRSYEVGANVEVDAYTAGSFDVNVDWFDANGTQIVPSSLVTSRSALTARTRFTATVTAPANAARGTFRFGWTGGSAQGNAYVDTVSFVPTGLNVTMKDHPGDCPGLTSWPPTPAQCGPAKAQWGSQRIIDFTASPATEIGNYRSPGSLAWPPPDDGLYAPRQARMFGSDVAFSTWLSDGLRVLDVRNPATPVERAAFDPPGVADPMPAAGAGPSNRADLGPIVRGPVFPTNALLTGVDIKPTSPDTGIVAVSDVNAGLYVLSFKVNRVKQAVADFTDDAKTDQSVFRPNGGVWFMKGATPEAVGYGESTDVPVPADYDGDDEADIAVYRPSVGTWYVHRSSDNADTAITYGGIAGDVPVPGDYDFDGKADVAIYRPSVGTWYVHRSSDNADTATTFGGVAGDIPVPADYDGDGRTDLAIFRGGVWHVLPSLTGTATATGYGAPGDIPVPGDYDGDRKSDLTIFRPSTALWSIKSSFGNPDTAVTFGIGSDVPVAGDYDGDGKTDVAIFRPSFATWWVHQSSNNADVATTYGIGSDIPLPLPYAIRRVFFP